MKYLPLLFVVLLAIPAQAQDSLSVGLPAWDIQYHVFSGNDYLKVTRNPYGPGVAIHVHETKYLRAIHVRTKDGCVTYLPTRQGAFPGLKKSGTGCEMFNFLSREVNRVIEAQQTKPLEKV